MICSRGLARSGGPKKKQTPGPRGTGANSAWLCLSPLLIPQVFLTVSPLETWILQLFLLFHLHLPVLLLSSIASPPHPWHGAALDTLTLYVDVLPLPGSPPGLVPRPGSWPSTVKSQSPSPWTAREFPFHLVIAICLFSSPHYSKHIHECEHTYNLITLTVVIGNFSRARLSR